MATKGEQTRERILMAAEALTLKQGFAGTSLDDVLAATGLTKGAFFHHFPGKADLGRAIIERFVAQESAMFNEWSARADRLSDDPLERTLIFLRLFEEFLDGLPTPHTGCVFAAYMHEIGKFGPEMERFIERELRRWQGLYERKFDALIADRPPVQPVTAAELAEMIVVIIEGALIMANAYRDRELVQRQSRLFRQYLELLFRRTN